MKKLFVLLLFLFSTVPSMAGEDFIVITQRQCVEFALVQYDVKAAIDAKKAYVFPESMPPELQVKMFQVSSKEEYKDVEPIAIAHYFLDSCIQTEGHFLVPEKL